MARTLALAAALILAIALAWLGEQPPAPRPAHAPAGVFSAERAMQDVRIIARAPHPMGSPANAAVRDHLLGRMSALGLDPQAFTRTALDEVRIDAAPLVVGGRPQVLVGVLPGRDRRAPAVALIAHYDSVPASPGAADDAAGVAAILEAVRALKAGPVLRRDLVVVFTDGEEVALLGARSFFGEHPLARRLGFVINLEARGGAGRARMFQAGAHDGETITLFREAVSRPSASSLAAFLFDMMPNDTDFGLAREAGLQGLNFAFVGAQRDYHAASSTPDALDRRSLQDIGDQALATARAAADARALPRGAPDRVFNQLPLGPLVAYPPPLGWLLVVLAAALLAVAVLRARRQGRLQPVHALRGAGAGLFLALAAAAVLRAARSASGVGYDELAQRRLLAHAELFEAALVTLAIGLMLYTAAELARGRKGVLMVPVVAGLVGAFAAGFDPASLALGGLAAAVGAATLWRPAEAPSAWAGLLACGLLASVALQVAAPLAAAIVAWPLLVASAVAALSALWTRRNAWIRGLACLGVVLALGWLGGFVHGIYQGLDRPELLALPLWIAAFVVWPLAQPDPKGAGTPFAAVTVLLSGLIVLAFVRFLDPWSAERPQPSQVVYLIDGPAQNAFRLSLTPERPAWAEAVLRAGGASIGRRAAPLLASGPVDAAPAPMLGWPAPDFVVEAQAGGRVRIRLTPPPGAQRLSLDFTANGPISGVVIGGKPSRLMSGPIRSGHIRWRGDTEVLEIAFSPGNATALAVRYGVMIPYWPAGADRLPARPRDVAPIGESDSTFVQGDERLTWPSAWAKTAP